jgi:hypothetical protein
MRSGHGIGRLAEIKVDPGRKLESGEGDVAVAATLLASGRDKIIRPLSGMGME